MKIEEVKNIPVINVMDPARAPAKKDTPKRATIVLSVFFLSFVGVVGYFVVKQQYGEQISKVTNKLRLLSVNNDYKMQD